MTETYSLAQVGYRADASIPISSTQLPDSSARSGGQAQAMMNGAQILCKNPDGSQGWYTIDAERSLPGYPPILKAVSP